MSDTSDLSFALFISVLKPRRQMQAALQVWYSYEPENSGWTMIHDACCEILVCLGLELVRFSRSHQLWGGVSLSGQRNWEMFQSILKWNKLAPNLYDDSSPAGSGPVVAVWVCVLQRSCLSCPGLAPGKSFRTWICVFLVFSSLQPSGKIVFLGSARFCPQRHSSLLHYFKIFTYVIQLTNRQFSF